MWLLPLWASPCRVRPATHHLTTKPSSCELPQLPAVQKGPGGAEAGLGGHPPVCRREASGKTATCTECPFWPLPDVTSESENKGWDAVSARLVLAMSQIPRAALLTRVEL